ncbi:MAG TPA: hypothetical protein PKC60_05790 [Hydrogenophaga sp.]|uniref:hypothetical protein n=1 Tax=Hydrogenophaga sp. TaxID=1904254 RepID=UPI002D168156|nr:hypothetical protein [Hydrogenophaga sp.]HMN92726.1 hypothetical protein [Hydrogenophaga sp.]HMP08884.1 hypothetical protein [Hydrogenophaga sp.]
MTTPDQSSGTPNAPHAGADWFERITGFTEGPYAWTQDMLVAEEDCLVSRQDGTRHRFGRFELVSLKDLRALSADCTPGPMRVRTVVGDARALHAEPAHARACFQVASQFNALEMVAPEITPEHGVTRYAMDRTQGPACALAAGAGTIWRNYLMPLPGRQGQTASEQLDALQPLGKTLSSLLGMPLTDLWSMQNGYALCTARGLDAIGRLLRDAGPALRDELRAQVCVGWHRAVDVTDLPPEARHQVDQVYCSALPVAYGRWPAPQWEPMARLVLEAAYEATLRAAWINRVEGGSAKVLLTGLGGGVFGNASSWIADALEHALAQVGDAGLEVLLVGHGQVPEHFRRYAA